jgi:predicted MPP superfamily phosphohydrolase
MRLEILHLSDLHLSSKNFADFSVVRAALLSRIGLQVDELGPPDIVIFSGDLVQAGLSVAEFEYARKEFIEPVLQAAKVSPDRFFIVPGNHDIDRESVRAEPELEKGLKLSLNDRVSLNAFIDKHSANKSSHHFARLAPYNSFVAKHPFAPSLSDTPFFTTHTLTVKGTKVGISCLNTAWRTTGEPDDVDYGQLLIGERAVRNSLNDLDACDIKIAVYHHPLKCLKNFDQSDCKSLLIKEFDLLMTGHCHEQRPELVIATSGRAVISESGALYLKRDYFNGFCWISFLKTEGRADFKIWRYEDENARNSFEPATNVVPNGSYSIQLSTPEEITRFLGVETACNALKPVLEELADEQMLSHFADTAAPKAFSELYVPAHVRDRSQYEQNSDTKSVEISEQEILSSPTPYVIYGPRESGKTTFALRLCLRSVDECEKIPLYVNLANVKAGTNSIERAIKRFSGTAFNSFDLANDLDRGNLRIVFDSFAIPQANAQSRQRKK